MQNVYLFVVRYPVPVTKGTSPSSPPSEERSTSKTGAASTAAAVPCKKNVVGNVTPTLPKPRNGVINTLSGLIMLPEEQRECFESGGDDVIEESEPNPTKQRRMAERRKDPIVAKNEGRKAKVNLNSFKSKYLTLKKKVSALQLEVGAKEDFILLVCAFLLV